MNIIVLAGGISTERSVSIVSGLEVCKALRAKGQRAALLDVYCGHEGLTPEAAFGEAYDPEAEAAYIRSFDDTLEELKRTRDIFFGPEVIALCQAADVVFLALHGADGENGKVQAAFDLMGITYTGAGYLASALAMDKALAKILMERAGVPVPKGVRLKKGMDPHTVLATVGFPLVVKPCCGGSSVGVSIVDEENSYLTAVEEAFSYETEIIVETYIKGREFSVGVVDGVAYPVIEIAPIEGFYDYKNKYSAGAAIETCPALLTETQTAQMQRYAVLGAEALGITGYGRLDFLMSEKGRIYCLEANTLPGMTPTSLLPQEAKALGIDFGQLCMKLIKASLE